MPDRVLRREHREEMRVEPGRLRGGNPAGAGEGWPPFLVDRRVASPGVLRRKYRQEVIRERLIPPSVNPHGQRIGHFSFPSFRYPEEFSGREDFYRLSPVKVFVGQQVFAIRARVTFPPTGAAGR
jgi:hypothetical protein